MADDALEEACSASGEAEATASSSSCSFSFSAFSSPSRPVVLPPLRSSAVLDLFLLPRHDDDSDWDALNWVITVGGVGLPAALGFHRRLALNDDRDPVAASPSPFSAVVHAIPEQFRVSVDVGNLMIGACIPPPAIDLG